MATTTPSLQLLLATATVALATPDATATAQPPAGFETAWASVAKDYHALVDAQSIVGSSLAFLHRDSVLASEVHGFADLESGRRVDADTIYHWASITKTFTGVAIMQLRDRDRLTLDDPIVDHIPALRGVHNPFGPMDAITLRHLMSHTSGFRGPTWPWGGGEDWHPHEPTTWEQLVAMIPYTEIEFDPGTRYSYSNPGIIFLGRVIEQLSGDDYEVYIDKNILKPLGMRRSYFDHTPYHLLGDRSNNYSLRDGKPVAGGLDFDTGITVSNGGLNAPVDDMLRYLRFLVGEPADETAAAVLARKSLEEMWQPHLLTDGQPSGMGLTWFLRPGAQRIIGHTGGQKSFSTFIYFDPESRTACVGAFNTSGGRGDKSAFGTTCARLFGEIFPLFVKPARDG